MVVSTPVLELRNVTLWRGETKVFAGLNLCIEAGESVAVLGGNGAGKSSLLGIMTGELHVAAMQRSWARLFGEDLWSQEELRGRIGIVMPEQVKMFHPGELAKDVVLSGLRGSYGKTRRTRFTKGEKKKAAKAMRLVGVRRLRDREFGGLSSGEQRRFLVARALVHEPEVLVLDEPTTALDLPGAWKFLKVVRELIQAGTAVMMVTHDAREIPPEIKRVVMLKKGRVLADGPKRQVLTEDLLEECYKTKVRVRWSKGFCDLRPK